MQEFTITNRYNIKIKGDIIVPENPIGTSFVLHGLGGFRAQDHIQVLAQTLWSNNYTVVNFDATNSIGDSGGEYENATLGRHYEDLVDVIAWAQTQEWYKEPLVLAGHSMGAYAIAQYAEDFPNHIQAVFPYATVVTGEQSFDAYIKARGDEFKIWKTSGWDVRTSISRPGLELRLPWSHMEERLNHNLLLKLIT